MTWDPLSVFLHEKVAAAEAPSTSEAAPRQVTKNPSPTSLDPGERAMAGLMAAGGSIAAKVVPWIVRSGLNSMANKGSVPANNAAWPPEAATKSKLLGLFDLTSRHRTIDSPRTEKAVDAFHSKIDEIKGVVDSFMDRHKLDERGVDLNFGRGPLSGSLGPRYHIPSKTVFLPSVGKEQTIHELGHAADYTGSRLGKIRGYAEPILRKGALVALPIALVAGDRIKEVMPGTIDDKAISFMQDHAPAIMGATLAATSLYPEAKASFLAVHHIAKTEGPAAARQALKKLVPAWGTYLLGAIPAVVGMSLARKYMREAREEKQQKTAGAFGDLGRELWQDFSESARDVGHIGKQIGHQTVALLQEPNRLQRIAGAAKEVGTSPEFVHAALASAIPATMGALYLYATPGGKEIRARIHPDSMHGFLNDTGKKIPFAASKHESWREQNPLRFAGLVAAGAALSGGVLAKFFSDLQRVV